VFSVTEARCRPYEDGSSSCDSGSDTTCGGAPVFQRGGADGQVLLRSVQESTDRQGYHTVRYYWRVTDSSALTNCGNGLHNPCASATGGEHPDDDMDRGWIEAEPRNWRDGGWREAHRNGALQLVAGGVPEAPPPPPPPPPEFAHAYTLSGSDGTSPAGDLDGVYSVVEARCRPYEDGSSSCDSGSDTTCGGAPVFQRGGADGPVLHRRVSESTDNQGYHTVRYYWIVADSSALTNCGNGLHGSFATASGGAYPDGTVERGWSEMEPRNWRDGGWRESHRNSDMAFVANPGGH